MGPNLEQEYFLLWVQVRLYSHALVSPAPHTSCKSKAGSERGRGWEQGNEQSMQEGEGLVRGRMPTRKTMLSWQIWVLYDLHAGQLPSFQPSGVSHPPQTTQPNYVIPRLSPTRERVNTHLISDVVVGGCVWRHGCSVLLQSLSSSVEHVHPARTNRVPSPAAPARERR